MIAYLGLGSNLCTPQRQLIQAIQYLQRQQQVNLLKVSPIFHSRAQGNSAMPNYLNLAIKINTTLPPHQLLSFCQATEKKFQRVRKKRWGSRRLDIDILLYGNQSIKTNLLQIPHAQLIHRDFVVIPLLSIEPDLQLPDGQRLSEIKFNKSFLFPHA